MRQARENTPQIAVVGAGFAGLRALSGLRRRRCDITLYEPRAATALLPVLPDVAGAWVAPQLLQTPLSQLLPPQVRHIPRAVQAIDLAAKRITDTAGASADFDAIIIAGGARTLPCPFDTPQNSAFTCDSLEQAVKLRDHFLRYLAKARQPHVVIVGAGYTGLELAAGLSSRARAQGVACQITVAEIAPRILPFLRPRQRKFLEQSLASLGVTVRTESKVTGWDGRTVTINGEIHEDVFFCWAAGTTFVQQELHGALQRLRDGRIETLPDLSVAGYPHIFVVGDAAAVMHKGVPLRKAVNFAWYGGRLAAHNAVARLRGGKTRPYRPRDLGWAIPLHDTGLGVAFGRIWFQGRKALRVHYLMCALRSWSFTQRCGFVKLAFKLFT